MQTLRQDLRYGTRTLAKNPGFIAVAVITLALGIGANTAIFSVVNAVLLRPLPYKEPDRLVAFRSLNLQSGETFGVSPADYLDWREQTKMFQQIALYTFGSFSFKNTEHPEQVPSARVSPNFFQTLGVQPLLGRTFSPEEGQLNGPQAVVLSYKLWQRRFGGDRTIIGRTIESYDPFASSQRSKVEGATANDGKTGTTIIGVMPPDFKFPSFVELWTPLLRDSGEMRYRASRYMQVVGRLRDGETIDSARSEMKTIAARLEMQYANDDKGWTIQLTSLREHLVRDTKLPLLILLGAVAFVLLISCTNVANLLLARAASRRKEIAVRLALGAGRWQLIQQLVVESLLLAFLGGAIGLLLASWGVDALVRLLPEYGSYRAPEDIHIDGTVLLFTFAIATVTGLIFGVVPGWQATRPRVNQWLKEGSRGSEGVQQLRVRSLLVVAEISLALVLLIGAGLLINSFARLRSIDLGYNSRGLFSMFVAAPAEQYRDAEGKARFYQQMLDEVGRVSGIEVTLTSSIPFGSIGFPFNIEGQPLPNGDASTRYSAVAPNYFRVLRAKLHSGRQFDAHDDLKSPAVAIVNETMVRQYFAGRSPIGERISLNYLNNKVVREIVGVVGDMKQDEIGAGVKPEVFVPFAQAPWFGQALVIRAPEDNLANVRNSVQRAIWNVDRNQATSRGDTIDQELKEMMAEPRLYTILLGTFAMIALLLAAVGIYGVMAYSVAQRTQEIGVRMALGAQMRDVLKLVLRNGMSLALFGVVIGLAGAFALTRFMSKLLFGVTPTDALTFATVAMLLLVVALLACYFPARRATKVDPLVALRHE